MVRGTKRPELENVVDLDDSDDDAPPAPPAKQLKTDNDPVMDADHDADVLPVPPASQGSNAGADVLPVPPASQGSNVDADADMLAVPPASQEEEGFGSLENNRYFDASAVELSPAQEVALQLALDGKNLFITGSAGTGKSLLVQRIIHDMKKRSKKVAVTAPTGVAAVNVAGQTIHSFTGIGLGEKPMDALGVIASRNRFVAKKIREIDVLVLDEVSMVAKELFEKIDYVFRYVRRSVRDRPFGGLQVIIVGDFFQLPPVDDRSHVVCPKCGGDTLDELSDEEAKALSADDEFKLGRCTASRCSGATVYEIGKRFAFESRSWDALRLVPIVLDQVFRQQDSEFVAMLNAMREGNITETLLSTIESCGRELPTDDGIIPTRLYPHRAQALERNQIEFGALKTPITGYNAVDTVARKPQNAQDWLVRKYMDQTTKALQVETKLELREGAQVMLTHNLDVSGGLVNGSRGVVTDFWEPGVALARLRKEGKQKNMANIAQIERFAQEHADVKFPVVRFGNGRSKNIMPVAFERQFENGAFKIVRTQIPLKIAYAVTIHKSQGLSLDKVAVSLADVFESGHAYVAISRARSLEGLQIESFNRDRVSAHPRVVEFMKSLAAVGFGQPSKALRTGVFEPQFKGTDFVADWLQF